MATDRPQQGFGFTTGAPDYARLKKFHADFTPEPITQQALAWLRTSLRGEFAALLDPSAGSGVFGKVARNVWPGIRTFGVEPRAEEEEHLARNYDSFSIDTFERHVETRQPTELDLVATNPPFFAFLEIVAAFAPRLRVGGALMLLGLSSVGQSAEGASVFDQFCPDYQLRVTGRINFRGPGINPETGRKWASDQRDYSWWIWSGPHGRQKPPCWCTIQLPLLPTHEREWQTRPGTG